jgi:hypothetical protein
MAGLLSLGARPSSTGTQDVGPGAPAILLKRSEPVVRQIAKAVAGRSDGVAVEYKALLRERCQRACLPRASRISLGSNFLPLRHGHPSIHIIARQPAKYSPP